MATGTGANFATTAHNSQAQITGANTNRDGSGSNIVTVITGTTNGTKVHEVVFKAATTTVAGIVRLFVFDGTNTRLFDEYNTFAKTVSGTVLADRQARVYSNLVLLSGWQLRATCHNASETWNVLALGADF